MKTLAQELMCCPGLKPNPANESAAMRVKVRKLRGLQWSCAAIAKELGLAKGTVERWLRGE